MNKRATQFLATASLLVASFTVQAADLVTVYREALTSDPQLDAAEAGYLSVQTLNEQARSAVMPKLNASGQYSRVETDGLRQGTSFTDSSNSTNYSLNLQQPLFHWEAFVAMRQADHRIEGADAEFAAAQQNLILRVADAYFGLLAARDNLQFAQAEKKAVEQQLRQTRQRFEVGLTAITDVHEAQARYDLVLAQEITTRNQLDTAREALRELTGTGYEELAGLSDEIPLVVPEPADIDAWVDAALEQNLQLIATRANTEAAREEVNRRKASRYPTLDFTASYGHSETPSFGLETDESRFGVQLNVPFYQGGLVSARSKEAALLHNQAQANLEAQRRQAVRQARDAFLAVNAGISQVKAYQQSLASAETALEATRAGFEVGTRTAVDVLDAQRVLYGARRDYAQGRYNYILATLQLKQAAGTLSPEDLQSVNAWLK